MRDPRAENLAKILVGYSTKVKEGEVVSIDGESAAEPLLLAVYEEVLKAGAQPDPQRRPRRPGRRLLQARLRRAARMDLAASPSGWSTTPTCGSRSAPAPTPASSPGSRPSARPAARRRPATLMNAGDGAQRRGRLPLVLHALPDQRLRLRGGDEPRRLRGLLLRRLPGRRRRPADRLEAGLGGDASGWPSGSRATRRCGSPRPGTDIKLGIAGRKFIPCDGDHNMPDGEFFTGPVEDSVEGEVTFHLPAVIGGREVSGVRLRFEAGKVVDASAERGEEFLIKLLDTDEGARRLGELGIGTNYAIDRGTREVLLDEKIGGTVHMAVGSQLPGVRRRQRVRRPHRPGLRPAPRRQARSRRRRSCRKTASSSSELLASLRVRRIRGSSQRELLVRDRRAGEQEEPDGQGEGGEQDRAHQHRLDHGRGAGRGVVSRMLFSQVGRIGARRLVPVMLDVEAVEAADQPGDEERSRR